MVYTRAQAHERRSRCQTPVARINEKPERKTVGRCTRNEHHKLGEPQLVQLPSPTSKRRRSEETLEHTIDRPSKRHRPAPESKEAGDTFDHIAFWASEKVWPSEFKRASTMHRLLATKKSSSSLGRKRSEPGSGTSATPSDQKPREEKTAPYRGPRYKKLLESKGVFMNDSELGINNSSRDTVRRLLESRHDIPNDTLFRNATFTKICRSVEDRNEARVIRDINPLLVPSAELFALGGASELDCLIESTNEGWNNALPLTNPRPQPDYSVAFRREAFSEKQLEKLSPFIGDWIAGDKSFFMGTYLMYFPFLSCEVKCGAEALDVADRQNAHTMPLAVRAIVELCRLVGREMEVHRQIIAFSISHDHQSVRIYGYYAEVQGDETRYYRHAIRKFDFTELGGKDRWTTYSFTRNIYDKWMPKHFEWLCSVIDQLPSHLDCDGSPLQELGLSQGLESCHSQSDLDSVNERGVSRPQEATPDTSLPGSGAAKRSRRARGGR